MLQISDSGDPGTRVWLTDNTVDEDSAHLAGYQGGLLAAWRQGTTRYVRRLGSNGQRLAPAEVVTASFRQKDDFRNFANGDVGWAAGSGSNLIIGRYGDCPWTNAL